MVGCKPLKLKLSSKLLLSGILVPEMKNNYHKYQKEFIQKLGNTLFFKLSLHLEEDEGSICWGQGQ